MTTPTPMLGTKWINPESCVVKILGVSQGKPFPSRSVTRRLFVKARDWADAEGTVDPKLFFQGNHTIYHHASAPESRIVFEFTFRGTCHHMLREDFLEKFQVFPLMGGTPRYTGKAQGDSLSRM
jgi:hypothetical protein